ncbi:MAG TPA: patatin-like phospholipase family protein [Casimicrobiaceae bacterium]|nr:patatin-like phospholipase family protein [Casimicrobiaceae bacterium]
MAKRRSDKTSGGSAAKSRPAARGKGALPGQVVLVLQGGGALGAYQVGVYEALHEAGIEPDWVIGTSIGAINGAIIAGNRPQDRLSRLERFWSAVEHRGLVELPRAAAGFASAFANLTTLAHGIAPFFTPNPASWLGPHIPLGIESAAYYSTAPLAETLGPLIDLEHVNGHGTRLTVGAVNVNTGEMRYFDSRDEPLALHHVLASGALPPAFPAVRIGGEPYWDGGIYSNTPLEAVLDDKPRRDSLIFAVHMWNPEGPEPETLWQVLGRHKEIQYASRARSHIARQKQIHHLRHVIRELAKHVPDGKRESAAVRELTSWGCGTTMHVVRLVAPRIDGEDHTKDIDFTAAGIRARRHAGYAATRRVIRRVPWNAAVDPIEGVVIHDDAGGVRTMAAGVDGFSGRTR